MEASHKIAGACQQRLAPGKPWEPWGTWPRHRSTHQLFWRGNELWLVPHSPFFSHNHMLTMQPPFAFFEKESSLQPALCIFVPRWPWDGHSGCLQIFSRRISSSSHLKMCFLKKRGYDCWLKPFTSCPFIGCPVQSVIGSWSERLITTAH